MKGWEKQNEIFTGVFNLLLKFTVLQIICMLLPRFLCHELVGGEKWGWSVLQNIFEIWRRRGQLKGYPSMRCILDMFFGDDFLSVTRIYLKTAKIRI